MLPASPHGGGRGRALMASVISISSLLVSPKAPSPSPHPCVPRRGLRLLTRAGGGGDRERPTAAAAERKSLAVATGELFLGLASLLVRRGGRPAAGEAEGREREGVIWEQRAKDVEAERRRRAVTSPGFSFSAAGLLFPYHLGVAQCLIDNGYITETTPLAGSSAGAIICAVVASGNTMQGALQVTKVLAEDCRCNGTAFRLGAVLRNILDNFLPGDVHIKCNGRIRVAITQLSWRPRGLLVDQFDSKEDVINAVIASSFIPGYLAPRPATFFRNRLCIDGGLTLFMPPTSASETVRVCAFPAGQLGLQGIGISPDCNPENRASPRQVAALHMYKFVNSISLSIGTYCPDTIKFQLFNWALEPAEDDILDNLFELGYLDAAVWAEQNPVEFVVKNTALN